ncbi:uncharacterized protein A4U43_C07F36510 [Asparagus officinalis]|uniref:Tubby C-terminal domain-containing protein n=1 Tax=Asparagus officinalis TaxID=4686 RepID=A0A5P1EMW3_ASPOF|nr:protein LURP-one-related 6-like [Asparagus officinalis]ONK65380.1 uncharacterized protein A4U43_C07F36510 [Asparagus officinalis]
MSLIPIVSKAFCAPTQTALTIRKRPRVVNGGGFVVLNPQQNVVFSVHGCGILGVNGELVVKDGGGASILFIRKKGGLVQALSACSERWRGYLMEFGRPNKPLFSLRDPKSCFAMKSAIRISVDRKDYSNGWDFEVKGCFLEKNCTINDRRGNIVAKVGVKVKASEDLYHVNVQPGYDQAFVIGVIAVLDNIYGESTRC